MDDLVFGATRKKGRKKSKELSCTKETIIIDGEEVTVPVRRYSNEIKPDPTIMRVRGKQIHDAHLVKNLTGNEVELLTKKQEKEQKETKRSKKPHVNFFG